MANQVASLKKRENSLLQSMAVASVVFGAGFIVLGLLMALNIVFPWLTARTTETPQTSSNRS